LKQVDAPLKPFSKTLQLLGMKSNILIFWGAALLVVSLWLAGCAENSAKASSPFEEAETSGPYEVIKVTDGDTIKVSISGYRFSVRPIGIDTPETVHPTKPIGCFGPESSDYAKDLLGGSNVYLEYDKSQAPFDKYKRVLAHVWTEEKELYASGAIQQGYGIEFTYATDYKYKQLYLEDQSKAKANSVGLWGSCPKTGQKSRN
jgi:endonuclease YncB( thermonuclease family)